MTSSHSEASGQNDVFVSTRWSVVLAAGDANQPESSRALQTLCRTYWRPVYVFIRGKGFSPEDAEELTQECFAQLLRGESLKNLRRERGKFRAFLLACARNFLANEWDRRKAKKRGGGQTLFSLEETSDEAWFASVTTDSPEKIYEKRWALVLLDGVMAKLQREFEREKQPRLFQSLKPFLAGDAGAGNYAAIGRSLEMSEGAVKVAVHRLRRRYRDLLRAEISETVSSPEEVEDEIRHLFQLFD